MIFENIASEILDFDGQRKIHPAEAYTCSNSLAWVIYRVCYHVYIMVFNCCIENF